MIVRAVRRDHRAEDSDNAPADDHDLADDEGRSSEQELQGLAACLRTLGHGRSDGRRDGLGRDGDVHQRSASSRMRGFIQAIVMSATSVASMYTMPTMITPAVSIGRSLFWAANSIVWPIPLYVKIFSTAMIPPNR